MARLVLFIALGGAIGSVARFLLTLWVQPVRPGTPLTNFPVGTLVVNVTGCLAIGILHAVFYGSPHAADERPELRAFLIVGVLGGYTTFSSFSLQTLDLLREGHAAAALGNIAGSVALCLVAVAAGVAAAGLINAAR